MSETRVPTRVSSGVATGAGTGMHPTGAAGAVVGPMAAVQAAGAGPVVEVTCPGCGTPAHVQADRRSATDFCATCDHPLFWAGPRTGSADVRDDDGLDARYRAPGVVGTSQHGALPCPRCGEQNHATWSACVRCGSDLTPPPPAPIVPPPAPAPAQVVTVERPVACGHPPVWVVALITSIVTTAVVAGAFLILQR